MIAITISITPAMHFKKKKLFRQFLFQLKPSQKTSKSQITLTLYDLTQLHDLTAVNISGNFLSS